MCIRDRELIKGERLSKRISLEISSFVMIKAIGRPLKRIFSVSYTHLDVYKRQGQHRRNV